jgi:hypothetical protein
MIKAQKSGSARLFWIVILGIVLYLVLDVVAQMLPPHFSPISRSESALAIGKFGYIMTANFLVRGVLSLLFIFAFLRTLDFTGVARDQFRTGTYLLGVWAVGAILIAIFPTDVPSTPVSWHGAIHLVVAIVAFTGGAFGTLAISKSLKPNQLFEGLKRIAVPLSVIVVVLWVVEFISSLVPHLNSRVGGFTERLFLGSVLLWLGVVSAYLATHLRTLEKAKEQKMKF